jgi:hypothetical protein
MVTDNDWRAEAAAHKAKIQETLDSLGLTIESVFVPFSKSRNKGQDRKSLNWSITVKRNGRDVLTTDYSAGVAHCPAYNRKVPAAWNRPARMWRPLACEAECENGYALGIFTSWGGFNHDKKKPILPDPVDVFHNLTMDSSVLDSGGFEDWAADYGYDTDSRRAVSTYRACLEIALKFRAAIGETGMEALKTAFEDY